MRLPEHPVTLTPQQIEQICKQLSNLRHNVNNHLALIVAATELMKRKPEVAPRLVVTLDAPPQKISAEVKAFSDALENILQVIRP